MPPKHKLIKDVKQSLREHIIPINNGTAVMYKKGNFVDFVNLLT